MGGGTRASLERLIIMGRTYRHDNKDSWSKPKFKRSTKKKREIVSRSLEEDDYFEPTYKKVGLDINNELGEDLEDYES